MARAVPFAPWVTAARVTYETLTLVIPKPEGMKCSRWLPAVWGLTSASLRCPGFAGGRTGSHRSLEAGPGAASLPLLPSCCEAMGSHSCWRSQVGRTEVDRDVGAVSSDGVALGTPGGAGQGRWKGTPAFLTLGKEAVVMDDE